MDTLKRVLSLILFGSLISSNQVFATTETPGKNLIIGVEDISYYPYFDYNDNNDSLSKTILDKFAADQGYTLTYLPLPIKQFAKWLYINDIDFKYPDNRRWHTERDKKHAAQYYSNDMFYLTAGTVVLLANKQKPKDFFKNLGMISGFDPTLWKIDIANKRVSLLDDTSPKVLLKYLVNGIVDGVDLDIAVAEHYLTTLALDNQLTYSDALPQEVFAHQLSTIKHPEIITLFNQWLAQNGSFIQAAKVKFNVPTPLP